MDYDEYFLDACKKLGNNIRRLREEKQISIKELSEKTGIRTEYLNKIENGKAYGVMLEKHLLKISKVLKVNMSELLKF